MDGGSRVWGGGAQCGLLLITSHSMLCWFQAIETYSPSYFATLISQLSLLEMSQKIIGNEAYHALLEWKKNPKTLGDKDLSEAFSRDFWDSAVWRWDRITSKTTCQRYHRTLAKTRYKLMGQSYVTWLWNSNPYTPTPVHCYPPCIVS